MRRTMSMVFLVGLLSSALQMHGVYYQEVFLQANKLYKEREYEKALEAYASLPNKSTAVWYNTGNGLYHLGNYIEALVAFKRAERDATSMQRQAIEHNIHQVREALDIPPAVVSYAQRLYEFFTRPLGIVSLLFLQIMFLLLLYCTFFCMRRMFRSKKYGICFVWLTGLTFWCGISLGIKAYDTRYERGIVIQQQGTMFVGPDKKYDASGTIMLADELIILEKRAEWYKVKKGKLFGWVPAEFIAEID